MRKLLFPIICLLALHINAQQFRYGFGFSPQQTWWAPEGDLYDETDHYPRISYGLIFDQTIGSGEHFAITTGLTLDYTQCTMSNVKEAQGASEKQWTIRSNFIEIPLSLRLRTGQLSKFVFYAEGGAMGGKCLRSRGDYDQNGLRYDSDIDYLQNDNPNGLNSLNFNAAITFGAGTEISITETASLMVGFFYNKGMMNVVDDNNENNDILLNQMGIHIAGLF